METDTLACYACGQAMTLDANEVSNHLDADDRIDYDADADHVALLPVEMW